MPERPLFSQSFNFDRFRLPFFGRISGYNGDGKLVVGRVAPLNVEVSVIGFIALGKKRGKGASVSNVVVLAFGSEDS